MKFIFEGRTFRIVFQHDPSRAWSDHIGHGVSLIRFPLTGDGKIRIFLRCAKCKLIIGNVPKRLRQRETHCSIEEQVAGNELGRPDWNVLAAGSSRTNRKAGDRFERSAGREAALQNVREALANGDKLKELGLPLQFLDTMNDAYYHPGNAPSPRRPAERRLSA